jgi:hypothetical protein
MIDARRRKLFWAKVDRSGGSIACWPWLGTRDPKGYGQFYVGVRGKPKRVHRITFWIKHGHWPTRALHTCDFRACCNPRHVYEGTTRQNHHDRLRRGPRNEKAKLTVAQVRQIRRARERSSIVAKQFNVSRGTVWAIRARKAWRWA